MKIFSIILAFLLLVSCDLNNTIDGKKEFLFHANSQIIVDSDSFARIESGENLVFEYFYMHEHKDDIADDELSERIIFEIDPNIDSFSFSNTDLTDSNAFFDQYCFCYILGSIPISDGTIQGTKIDNETWDININISFINNDESKTQKVNHIFVLKED